jgi:hypothetical protein
MTLITKSKYLDGIQCPGFLWLRMNDPSKIPEMNDEALHRMDEGTKVGQMATGLYPNGIGVPEEFKENLDKTEELLSERKALFEPGFKVKTEWGEIFARLDVLVPAGKDEWDIVEVKGGTKVKDLNVEDVAFQKYVCEKAGLKIRKCFLCHVNNEFVKSGEIDLKEFFVVEDICDKVDELYESVEGNLERLFEVIALPGCPKVTSEDILNAEYSNILIDEFYDSLPEENVFELYKIRKTKALELYEKGILKIKDIPEHFKMTDKQEIQAKCSLSGKSHGDCEKIKEFLDGLKYPLYYLDFETFSTVVPIFDKTKPYQHIPFQFSLHVVDKKGAEPRQVSFLADGGKDPRKKFLQELKDNLGDKGSIIVYSESFEKGRIKESIGAFPEVEEWGNGILDRVVDLLKPFRNFHYYHPKQKGSASIKNVLPIFSNDVNYKDLIISNGMDASISYYKSHFEKTSDGEKKKIRYALEKYCELDTYAEVLLVNGLREVVK